MAIYGFIIAFVVFTAKCCFGLEIINPSEIEGHYNSPPLKFGMFSFNLTGELVYLKNSCESLPQINGGIALVDPDNCYPQDKARNCQRAGATAVVITSYTDSYAGWLYYYENKRDNSDIVIPCVELSQEDAAIIHPFISKAVTLRITSKDANPFRPLNDSPYWYFVSIVNIGIAITVAILAAYKLFKFIKYKGVLLEPAPVTFVTQIFGSLGTYPLTLLM